jgi:hypothetical protein
MLLFFVGIRPPAARAADVMSRSSRCSIRGRAARIKRHRYSDLAANGHFLSPSS